MIVADRFVRFFQITSSAYSFKHNAVNAILLFPLYALGTIGVVFAWGPDTGRRRLVVIALMVWLFAFASFHALTILDSDWRYRAPLMPQFILLAAIGMDGLAQRLSARITHQTRTGAPS